MVSKSSPILIVGGGAFGLSTALHLTKDGYTNITVFERDEQIPPRYSAANDLNKIVRAEYEDPFYTDLTVVRPSTPISHLYILISEESNLRVENPPLRPLLPSNRLPTLRLRHCPRKSHRNAETLPSRRRRPPGHQTARRPPQRARRHPAVVLAVRWRSPGLAWLSEPV